VLRLPGNLTAANFLARHWQKKLLFMPQAATPLRPSLSRNELAWLAMQDDVESRVVFTERGDRTRYHAVTGPFDADYLSALPRRDWTLLVHDVDKHLPAMRRLFALVPFVPDWRIDDLMVSFAAPGGGVGPHVDRYDVFLCQGIGTREWRYTKRPVRADRLASDTLKLTDEFSGDARHLTRQGDILYLPPGVAHWGRARHASMTYSIGMRAPRGYADPDLGPGEAIPGYISPAARRRAGRGAGRLGREVTRTKEWLCPEAPGITAIDSLSTPEAQALALHGMARLAFDDERVFVNGRSRRLNPAERGAIAELCRRRRLTRIMRGSLEPATVRWLLRHGAFELPPADAP
jgi:hypothetical protein